MKTKYISSLILGALLLGSCSSESPFVPEEKPGTGSFNTASISLDVRNGEETMLGAPNRAEAEDFKILFFKNGNLAPELTYNYSEMPDVVVLPIGKYKVTATRGSDVEAEWESPYFIGNSEEFEIKEDVITSDIDPIICTLQNVQVTVDFAPMLSGNMSPDSYVEVKVGDNAGLQFTKEHEGVAGHFRHTDGVSLVATFHGEVEGLPTVETKSFDQVQKGHHYKITFKLHSKSEEHYGEADASINVDASVTTVDLENNIVIGEDEDLGDDERPREDLGDEPTPPTGNNPPTITAKAPIVLDADNIMTEGMECVVTAVSSHKDGITKFTCDIISDKLDAQELSTMGLGSHLNLAKTDPEQEEALANLGFPVNIKGEKSVVLDISPFMNLLAALGNGRHEFKLVVGDANGETVKSLILVKQ